MWFTLRGLADALRTEDDLSARLLLLSTLEQGVCDLASANVPSDVAQYESLVERLRDLTLDHARAALGGTPARRSAEWMTTVDGVADLRFSGVCPPGFPVGFGRRKFWTAIPEALSVHHDTLESVVASARRAVADANALPSLVIGIRSSGSLLAPLVAALCSRDGQRMPYATLRPLIDRKLQAGSGDVVALDDAARRLIAACRGAIWIVDDPSDSGRTKDAAVTFVARLAPQCAVSFVPIGEQSRALRDYDRQMGQPVTRLAPREVHEEHNRTTWLDRRQERVYKAYGDLRLARLECRALRAASAALDYDAAGEFVSSRFLGEAIRTAPDRAQVVALGEAMARYREIFRVEPVPFEVWSGVLRRRGGRSAKNIAEPSAVDNLVRSNGQLAWWHYRWTGRAVERVSAELGHWSTVVDMGELLASAFVELALDGDAFRSLVDVYASSSGDRDVSSRINGCLHLYVRSVKERIERASAPELAGYVEERRAALEHGLAWLESANR